MITRTTMAKMIDDVGNHDSDDNNDAMTTVKLTINDQFR